MSKYIHNEDPWSTQVSSHSWKTLRKWYWEVQYSGRFWECGYCFTKKSAYKKAGMKP